MAMRTASPWWASLIFGIGLLLILLGERLFGHLPGLRMVLTALGVLTLLAVTGLRGYTMMRSTGGRRAVERTFLLCQLGVLGSLVLYALTTRWGLNLFGITEKGAGKWTTVLTVLWTIGMLKSLIPMFMIEMSLGIPLRTAFDLRTGGEEGVEYYRVREISWSGVTIALATAFLMVTCGVAKERNVQRDVSYFKTSSPGDSTKRIVAASSDPIKVMLFFPTTNEVKEQVKNYFDALQSASGHMTVEVHDRFVDAELAGKYKVTKDGVSVLVKCTGDKEKSQNIEVDTDIEKARKGSKLRNFDREVNSQLLKLVRDKRKAYVMTGHGEMTDPDSIPPMLKGSVPERRTTVFKKRLGDLNYEVKDLGLIDLAKDVPEDATIVLMLAPTVPLMPAEWAALSRYLDKGGRLMIALDPKADPSLGELEGKLGLKYNPGSLTDDQAYLPQRGTPADRRFAITTQFSAHASTTTLSRSVDKGLIVIDSGAIEDAPFTGKDQPKKTMTIRSMDSSFLDFNNNFSFDAGTEKRQKWNLAAAVEGPKLKGEGGKEKDGYRVLMFADADLFADVMVSSMGRAALVMVSGPLLDDTVKWLGGEEVFVGEVVSEDDKPIKHTKSQDAVWFTLTIVGAPLLVLTLGLVGTWARRRRSMKKTAEVKP